MRLLDVSTRNNPNTFAQVDDELYDELAQWKWSAQVCNGHMRVMRSFVKDGKKTTITLHQQIMGGSRRGMMIAHKDGDPLNCQRANLYRISAAEVLAGRKSPHWGK